MKFRPHPRCRGVFFRLSRATRDAAQIARGRARVALAAAARVALAVAAVAGLAALVADPFHPQNTALAQTNDPLAQPGVVRPGPARNPRVSGPQEGPYTIQWAGPAHFGRGHIVEYRVRRQIGPHNTDDPLTCDDFTGWWGFATSGFPQIVVKPPAPLSVQVDRGGRNNYCQRWQIIAVNSAGASSEVFTDPILSRVANSQRQDTSGNRCPSGGANAVRSGDNVDPDRGECFEQTYLEGVDWCKRQFHFNAHRSGSGRSPEIMINPRVNNRPVSRNDNDPITDMFSDSSASGHVDGFLNKAFHLRDFTALDEWRESNGYSDRRYFKVACRLDGGGDTDRTTGRSGNIPPWNATHCRPFYGLPLPHGNHYISQSSNDDDCYSHYLSGTSQKCDHWDHDSFCALGATISEGGGASAVCRNLAEYSLLQRGCVCSGLATPTSNTDQDNHYACACAVAGANNACECPAGTVFHANESACRKPQVPTRQVEAVFDGRENELIPGKPVRLRLFLRGRGDGGFSGQNSPSAKPAPAAVFSAFHGDNTDAPMLQTDGNPCVVGMVDGQFTPDGPAGFLGECEIPLPPTQRPFWLNYQLFGAGLLNHETARIPVFMDTIPHPQISFRSHPPSYPEVGSAAAQGRNDPMGGRVRHAGGKSSPINAFYRDEIKIIATPREGWKLKGWNQPHCGADSLECAVTVSVAGNVNIEATFEPKAAPRGGSINNYFPRGTRNSRCLAPGTGNTFYEPVTQGGKTVGHLCTSDQTNYQAACVMFNPHDPDAFDPTKDVFDSVNQRFHRLGFPPLCFVSHPPCPENEVDGDGNPFNSNGENGCRLANPFVNYDWTPRANGTVSASGVHSSGAARPHIPSGDVAPLDSRVTFTATPLFAGQDPVWSGDCVGIGPVCVTIAADNLTVLATFPPYPSVFFGALPAGHRNGGVVREGGGRNSGFVSPPSARVTFFAEPNTGWRLFSWNQPGCADRATVCAVSAPVAGELRALAYFDAGSKYAADQFFPPEDRERNCRRLSGFFSQTNLLQRLPNLRTVGYECISTAAHCIQLAPEFDPTRDLLGSDGANFALRTLPPLCSSLYPLCPGGDQQYADGDPFTGGPCAARQRFRVQTQWAPENGGDIVISSNGADLANNGTVPADARVTFTAMEDIFVAPPNITRRELYDYYKLYCDGAFGNDVYVRDVSQNGRAVGVVCVDGGQNNFVFCLQNHSDYDAGAPLAWATNPGTTTPGDRPLCQDVGGSYDAPPCVRNNRLAFASNPFTSDCSRADFNAVFNADPADDGGGGGAVHEPTDRELYSYYGENCEAHPNYSSFDISKNGQGVGTACRDDGASRWFCIQTFAPAAGLLQVQDGFNTKIFVSTQCDEFAADNFYHAPPCRLANGRLDSTRNPYTSDCDGQPAVADDDGGSVEPISAQALHDYYKTHCDAHSDFFAREVRQDGKVVGIACFDGENNTFFCVQNIIDYDRTRPLQRTGGEVPANLRLCTEPDTSANDQLRIFLDSAPCLTPGGKLDPARTPWPQPFNQNLKCSHAAFDEVQSTEVGGPVEPVWGADCVGAEGAVCVRRASRDLLALVYSGVEVHFPRPAGGKLQAESLGARRPSGFNHLAGSPVTFFASPDRGFRVGAWSQPGCDERAPRCVASPLENVTVAVAFVDERDAEVEIPEGKIRIHYEWFPRHDGTLQAAHGVNEIASGAVIDAGLNIIFRAFPLNGSTIRASGTCDSFEFNTSRWYDFSNHWRCALTPEADVFITINFHLPSVTFSQDPPRPSGGVLAESQGRESGFRVRPNTPVNFTASPDPGWRVGEWNQAGCAAGAGSCRATVGAEGLEVRAVFRPQTGDDAMNQFFPPGDRTRNCGRLAGFAQVAELRQNFPDQRTVGYECTADNVSCVQLTDQFDPVRPVLEEDDITYTYEPLYATRRLPPLCVATYPLCPRVGRVYKSGDPFTGGECEILGPRITYSWGPETKGEVSAKSNGLDVASGTNVVLGSRVTFTAKPISSLDAPQWGGDCEGEAGLTCERRANRPLVVNVVFRDPIVVRYAASPPAGVVNARALGTLQDSGFEQAAGAEVAFTADPADGWEIRGWSQADCGTEEVCLHASTEDFSMTVYFGPAPPNFYDRHFPVGARESLCAKNSGYSADARKQVQDGVSKTVGYHCAASGGIICSAFDENFDPTLPVTKSGGGAVPASEFTALCGQKYPDCESFGKYDTDANPFTFGDADATPNNGGCRRGIHVDFDWTPKEDGTVRIWRHRAASVGGAHEFFRRFGNAAVLPSGSRVTLRAHRTTPGTEVRWTGACLPSNFDNDVPFLKGRQGILEDGLACSFFGLTFGSTGGAITVGIEFFRPEVSYFQVPGAPNGGVLTEAGGRDSGFRIPVGEDAQITFVATPNPGFEVLRWLDDTDHCAAGATVCVVETPGEDVDAKAEFRVADKTVRDYYFPPLAPQTYCPEGFHVWEGGPGGDEVAAYECFSSDPERNCFQPNEIFSETGLTKTDYADDLRETEWPPICSAVNHAPCGRGDVDADGSPFTDTAETLCVAAFAEVTYEWSPTAQGMVSAEGAGLEVASGALISLGTTITFSAVHSSLPEVILPQWGGSCEGAGGTVCVRTAEPGGLHVTVVFGESAFVTYGKHPAPAAQGGQVTVTGREGDAFSVEKGSEIRFEATPVQGWQVSWEGVFGGAIPGCDAGETECVAEVTDDLSVLAIFRPETKHFNTFFPNFFTDDCVDHSGESLSYIQGVQFVSDTAVGLVCRGVDVSPSGGAGDVDCVEFHSAYDPRSAVRGPPNSQTYTLAFEPLCHVLYRPCPPGSEDLDDDPFTLTGAGRCEARAVEAFFEGSGPGTVSAKWHEDESLASGALVSVGMMVTFSADADSGAEFSGWEGDCASFGTGRDCVLRMVPGVGVARAVFACLDFHGSASGGSLAGVRCNVESGVDVDSPNAGEETAVYLAGRGGHSAVVDYLVGEGAGSDRLVRHSYSGMGGLSANWAGAANFASGVSVPHGATVRFSAERPLDGHDVTWQGDCAGERRASCVKVATADLGVSVVFADLDECQLGTDDCGRNSECANLDPVASRGLFFSCACDATFISSSGDGKGCGCAPGLQEAGGVCAQVVTLRISAAGDGEVVARTGGVVVTSGGLIPRGVEVEFTARPGANLVFGGWSGACSGTELVCRARSSLSGEALEVGAVFSCVQDFHASAGRGDLSGVECNLTNDVDPDLLNADGDTALFLALAAGHSAVVNRLLFAKASPNRLVEYNVFGPGVLSASRRGDAVVVDEEKVPHGALVTFTATPDHAGLEMVWGVDCAGAEGANCVRSATRDLEAILLFNDVDECALGTDDCGVNSACTNLDPGRDANGRGFSCACMGGVESPTNDGRNCGVSPLGAAVGEASPDRAHQLLDELAADGMESTVTVRGPDGRTVLDHATAETDRGLVWRLIGLGAFYGSGPCLLPRVVNPVPGGAACVNCGSGEREVNGLCIDEEADLPKDATICRDVFRGDWVQVEENAGICSGIDFNDTFCIGELGPSSALSCLGLFDHVRACNMLGRPALDPWHCAGRCGSGRAAGAGCLK